MCWCWFALMRIKRVGEKFWRSAMSDARIGWRGLWRRLTSRGVRAVGTWDVGRTGEGTDGHGREVRRAREGWSGGNSVVPLCVSREEREGSAGERGGDAVAGDGDRCR